MKTLSVLFFNLSNWIRHISFNYILIPFLIFVLYQFFQKMFQALFYHTFLDTLCYISQDLTISLFLLNLIYLSEVKMCTFRYIIRRLFAFHPLVLTLFLLPSNIGVLLYLKILTMNYQNWISQIINNFFGSLN